MVNLEQKKNILFILFFYIGPEKDEKQTRKLMEQR